LISFAVEDKAIYRDKPFDLLFYSITEVNEEAEEQLIGSVSQVMLHAQYAFNTLKKRTQANGNAGTRKQQAVHAEDDVDDEEGSEGSSSGENEEAVEASLLTTATPLQPLNTNTMHNKSVKRVSRKSKQSPSMKDGETLMATATAAKKRKVK